jgi:hypothetical protein
MTPASPPPLNIRRLWIPFFVALVVHLATVLVIRHYDHPILWEIGVIANDMEQGYGFAMDFAGPHAPTSWQAPGYPFVLYFFQRWLGHTPTAYLTISIIQCLLISTMIFPMAWMTHRWFGERAAWISAWVVCFLPIYAWYCTRLHQPAIVMSIYPWAMAAWFFAGETKKLPAAIAAGVLTGIGSHFSPTMMGVFGIISFALILRFAFLRDWPSMSLIVVGGLCTLVTITPWTIRNYRVHGRLIPIKDSLPKELWYGNNPQATGTPFFIGGKEAIGLPADCAQLYGKVTEMQMMDAIKIETMTYIKSDPGAFARRTAKKILWLWTAVPPSLLRTTGDAEAVKFYWLHSGYWFLLLIGLAAIIVTRRLDQWEYILSLAVVFLIYSITYGLTIVGNARFRGEIEFVFIPAFAGACAMALDWLAKKRLSDSNA